LTVPPGDDAPLDRFDRVVGRVSGALARAGEAALLALIAVTIFEVAARYLFNRPTLWAYDVAYMLSGACVMLGAAWALRVNGHVRIDVFASLLPARVQQALQIVGYVALFLPALAVAAWAATARAVSAFATVELQQVSAWAPQVWPFYAVIALGLVALWCESAAAVLRHVQGFKKREPVPGGGV